MTKAILDHMAAQGIDAYTDWIVVTGDWNTIPYTSNPYHVQMFANLTNNGFRNTWNNFVITLYSGPGIGMMHDMAFVSQGLENDLGVIDAVLVPESGDPDGSHIPGPDEGIASDHWAFTLLLQGP